MNYLLNLHGTSFLLSMAVVSLVDLLVYFKWKSIRFFLLHVFVNSVVVLSSTQEMITVLGNPLRSFSNNNVIPMNIVLVFHVYHMLVYSDLKPVDWIHHLVMMGTLILPFLDPAAISVTNAIMFFTCGLPGLIDYSLMAAVKSGKIDLLTEKQVNTLLNTWIRGPGILACAYVCYLRYRYCMYGNLLFVVLSTAALYWNAQYFTKAVAFSYGEKREARKTKK